MKPKNVMLLGFVNKAVKYLDQNLDDGSSSRLSELRNIDLENIKNDLSHNIDQSLGVAQSTINTLLQIGGDVFDDFISVHNDSGTLSGELNRMFDVSFDEQEKNDQQDLEELLSFYNLDGSFDLDEKQLEQLEQEEKYVEIYNIDNEGDTRYVEVFNIDNLPSEKQLQQDYQEETKPEQLDEDLHYIEIFNRDRYLEELISIENEAKQVEEEIDEIINEYIEVDEKVNEQAREEEIEIEIEDNLTDSLDLDETEESDEEEEPEFELSDEDKQLLELIANNVNKANDKQDDNKQTEEASEEYELDNIFEEVVSHEDEEEVKEEDNPLPEQVDHNDIIKLLQEIQISDDQYYGNIEDFTFDDQFPEEEEIIEHQEDEDVVEDEIYVSSLIEDLRKQMIQEDEEKRVQEEEYKQVYDRIHKLYPYISSSFIRSVYDLKHSITNDYPLGKRIIILHRCIFKDVENLRQFVEIGLSHGYSINADEDKLMVDIFKEHINSDGKILSTIFEVANQSALLNGQYDGYRVMLVEKV